MKHFNLILYFLFLLFLNGCTKIEVRKPLSSGGDKPDIVKVLDVENKAGYAIIRYELPRNQDLQYVLAEYNINETSHRQAKATVSTNEIKVEGFGEAGLYNVKLYAVSKSEVRSEAVQIEVNPSVPPFRAVLQTLVVEKSFGGINISFSNPDSTQLAISVITVDEEAAWYTAYTHYTSAKGGKFAARGFEPEERQFGIYVRDKYNNQSDTIYVTETPLLERLIDKSKFQHYMLPTDTPSDHGWVHTNLWDNNIGTGYHSPDPMANMPAIVTIDMRTTVTFSRFKIWQRAGYFYAWGSPREYDIYGSNNPNPNGALDDSWTLLMNCESFKPSGGGGATADDIAYASAGEEYEFPQGIPPVRYVRLVFKRSWSDSNRIHVMEVSFWGAEQ